MEVKRYPLNIEIIDPNIELPIDPCAYSISSHGYSGRRGYVVQDCHRIQLQGEGVCVGDSAVLHAEVVLSPGLDAVPLLPIRAVPLLHYIIVGKGELIPIDGVP